MRPLPESLETTCPMCGEDLVLVLADEACEPAPCRRCGYRLDADAGLRDHGLAALLNDESDTLAR